MAADRISTKVFSGYITAASVDVVVENGHSIIVDSLIINNQNGYFGQYFKMTDTKGRTLIDLYLRAGEVVVHNSSFLADTGLIVKAGGALISYTIFYKGS